MTAGRIARWLRAPILFALLPLLGYWLLRGALATGDPAGILLGTVSGQSLPAITVMAAALVLRGYTMLLLPGLVAYRLSMAILSLRRRHPR